MADLTLYHAAPSRSSIVLWMLEEVGEPYEIKLLKLSEGDNLKPDYLAINPMGKVPALRHGEKAQCAGRRSAAWAIPEMAVLRSRLLRACGHRPRCSAQGAGAARHAGLRRF